MAYFSFWFLILDCLSFLDVQIDILYDWIQWKSVWDSKSQKLNNLKLNQGSIIIKFTKLYSKIVSIDFYNCLKNSFLLKKIELTKDGKI